MAPCSTKSASQSDSQHASAHIRSIDVRQSFNSRNDLRVGGDLHARACIVLRWNGAVVVMPQGQGSRQNRRRSVP
jgi:hypothetical protein